MRHFIRTYCLAAALAPAALAAQASADLVLRNGRIYTADENRPVVSAIAVRADRIIFAGSDAEAAGFAAKRTVDLHGNTVLPGLADAHIHLLGVGQAQRNVDLVGARTYEDVVARVVARAKEMKRGEWILGRGWDQNLWPSREFPTHDALSRAVPNNPVVLGRIDGHAILANRAAMTLAGITAATKDPSGGRVVRDAGGNPTGVFVDNAEGLVSHVIPSSSHDELKRALLAAVTEVNSWGLSSIQDPGESPDVIAIYEELAREGGLNVRAYLMLSDPHVYDSARWANSATAAYSSGGAVVGPPGNGRPATSSTHSSCRFNRSRDVTSSLTCGESRRSVSKPEPSSRCSKLSSTSSSFLSRK